MSRTAVITGCSTGFGRVTALHLARHGWRVLATVRRESDCASLLAEAKAQSASGCLLPVLCDITCAEEVERLRQAVAEQTEQLHGLVNNAGTGYPGPLELLPLDDLRVQLELNLVAQLAVTQALLPALKAGRGTLINVSSIGGRIAYPVNGAYHMSKFGLEAMSDALRLELAPFGVKVVVIEPGSSPTAIWETSLQRARQKLDPERLHAYLPLLEAVERVALHSARHGFPPQLFAEAVRRILDSRRPRARYPLPGSVAWMIAARQLLPDWLWDWGVRRVLNW